MGRIKLESLKLRRMKMVRILIYEGEVDWIETTLETSYIKPDSPLKIGSCTIKELLRKEVKTDE